MTGCGEEDEKSMKTSLSGSEVVPKGSWMLEDLQHSSWLFRETKPGGQCVCVCVCLAC